MFGFDPLTLSAGFILASLSSASCPAPGGFSVDAQLIQKDSPPVTDQTSEQLLQKYRSDHDASMATDGDWLTGGTTVVRGKQLNESVDVAFHVHEIGPDQACLSVSKVNYIINYAPAVYLASDLPAGCMYDTTVAHLQRHVALDAQILGAGVETMRAAVENYVSSLSAAGPFMKRELESQKEVIMRKIVDGISPEWKKLSFERQRMQKSIDTMDDYKKDTAGCPNQFSKYDGTKQ